jgi:hypothetical protein
MSDSLFLLGHVNYATSPNPVIYDVDMRNLDRSNHLWVPYTDDLRSDEVRLDSRTQFHSLLLWHPIISGPTSSQNDRYYFGLYHERGPFCT